MTGSRVKPVGTSAKALGALAPKITKAAFEAHGFPLATLIANWPDIAGTELAAFTRPERLAWPAGAAGRQGRGATLHVLAEGPRALEVQHAASQLIDRLNTHFGYRAVTQIRIVQAPVQRESRPDPAPRQGRERGSPEAAGSGEATSAPLPDIEDERLRDALVELGRRVR